MISKLLSEVEGRSQPWLGLGLVRVVCASLVFLESSLQSPGKEKHFGVLFIPLVLETQLSVET